MPQPVGNPISATDVARFMQREHDSRLVTLIDEIYLPQVRALVAGYTRGEGFTYLDDLISAPVERYADLSYVIAAVIARLASNPTQVEREEADGYGVRGRFAGFTLPEQAILTTYRRTSA